MFDHRVQIGDVKPLKPVWPQGRIEKLRRNGDAPDRDEEQRNRESRDEDDDKDGHFVDEYA